MRNWLTLAFIWSGIGLALSSAVVGQDSPPLVNSPLSPEESQKHFQIDSDCRIELVAAEPDVSAPVSIAFDEKGQLWVVEMHDYPNGPAPGEPGKSRIRVLTDEDGDGKYSNPRVFVDQLLFANSLMHWDGGVLVTTDGKLIYFKDTDGDGESDLREVWFEGFATENPQLRCNHPTFGPDNWIYVANGLRNGKVRAVRPKWPKPAPEAAKLGEPVDISGRDFRFNPFTGECEAVSGYGQFGLTFDDEGNRYVCSNRNPCMKVIIEERHLKLNPNLAVPRVVEDVSPAGEQSKLYPISRAWTTSNLHAGQFSAACGLIFYRGTALPEKFYNESFTCDPTGNLVHFNDQYGVRDLDEPEFLASDETWFRPVNTAMGPDGALYIVDMYRAVIEHPDYMPAELKTRPDLSLGAERGRIWRIVARTGETGSVSPRIIPLPKEPAEIAKQVAHPNGWHRDTAQRMLVEKRGLWNDPVDDLSSVEIELKRIMRREPSDIGNVVALRAMSGLGKVTGELLATVIQREELDESVVEEKGILCYPRATQLTREAVILSEDYVENDEALQQKLIALGRQRWSDNVAGPLELSLGQLGAVHASDRIAMGLEHKYWTMDSSTELQVVLGLADLLPQVLCQFEATWFPTEMVEPAAKVASDEQRNVILRKIIEHRNVDEFLLFARGVESRGISIRELISNSAELGDSWREFGAGCKERIQSRIDAAWEPFPENAFLLSDRGKDEVYVKMLGYLAPELSVPALQAVVASNPPAPVLRTAYQVVARQGDPQGLDTLLADFERKIPVARSAIIDGLLTSESRITKLLDLVESNQVSFLEIGQTRLASLQQVKNPEIQARLQRLIAANAPADRSKVLEEYQAALTHEHDPLRGRELFAKNCAQCHKIGDLGVEVAPNISDSRVKTQAQLLTDILDPNRAIDNNYFSYTLVDKAGTVATGIISAETSSSVTLKQPEGKTLTVLRSDIEQLKPNGVSLMPVGFEKQLTVAQMADLISFVKNWRYLDGSVPKEVIK